MINIHRYTAFNYNFIGAETLEYCYPFSLVKLEYSLGKDVPTQYRLVNIGYIDGRIVLRSKNPIPNLVKIWVEDYLGVDRCISTSDRNLLFGTNYNSRAVRRINR